MTRDRSEHPRDWLPARERLQAFLRRTSAALNRRSGSPPEPSLADIRAALEHQLTAHVLPFWYPEVVDHEAGGYRLHHDAAGAWKGPSDKALVAQARTLWFSSHLVNTGHGGAEHLAAARHGFAFLRERMWDDVHGGFYWAVDHTGRTATKPGKHLYGQAFGLYALAEYAEASEDSDAETLARDLFEQIETHAYDAAFGGYREALLRDWTPQPDGEIGYLGKPASLKLMNTHLHLMEAFRRYLTLCPAPVVRDRLVELILILSNAAVRTTSGACTDRHRRDWTPILDANTRVSYGHDLELVWLLLDACDTAGLPVAPLQGWAELLFATSLRHGFDRKHGGFFEAGRLGARADRRHKLWWVQAEALVCTLDLHQRFGDTMILDTFSHTLDWIIAHQTDHDHGDWHTEVSGVSGSGDKAGPWRTPYHHGRALVRCLDLLDAAG